MQKTEKRDTSLDILKFIAIYFVILGHTIQNLGEGMGVLEHSIGRFITMFNMPLFMFISGYLSMSTVSTQLLFIPSQKKDEPLCCNPKTI